MKLERAKAAAPPFSADLLRDRSVFFLIKQHSNFHFSLHSFIHRRETMHGQNQTGEEILVHALQSGVVRLVQGIDAELLVL